MADTTPLDDLCVAIVDCEHKTAPTAEEGIPSVRTSNIDNGKIDFANCNRVTEETYKEWTKRREPQPGDIILAREAPVGEVGIIPEGQRACLGQRTVLISPDRTKVNPAYLCYKLVSRGMKHEMTCRSEGSTVAHLNMSDIRELPIPPLPPLPEQRAIASILGALDDKIELNRRMNATLESLARAIFKSWFVDFDPVKINAGQMPASSQALATHASEVLDLFPATFQDSELGLIPEGWGVEPLSNLAEVVMGTSPKSSTYNENGEGAPLVNGPVEFGDYFPVKRKWTTAPTRFSEPNDLIFCVRGSTTGRRVLSDGVYCLGRGVCAIRSLNEHQAFINQTIEFELRRMLSRVTGSVFPNLSASQIKGFKIVAPMDSVLTDFSQYIEPIEKKMAANVLESETLSFNRDVLLPQLLSGELPVPAALTRVEEALV